MINQLMFALVNGIANGMAVFLGGRRRHVDLRAAAGAQFRPRQLLHARRLHCVFRGTTCRYRSIGYVGAAVVAAIAVAAWAL